MRELPSTLTLQKIAESAHVPAVGYALAKLKEASKHEFASTSLTFGKKNAQSIDVDMNEVNGDTRLPASSLSKIVFTYLVLQLVKEKQIDLDKPLLPILQYERFLVDGKYPEKATQLTARHVLSHTTGLPNLGSNLSSTLLFDSKSALGEGYSYSGEAFLYLQRVIEKKMRKDLETLAQEYVFNPLKMNRSTFKPQPKDDANIVAVHTELGKPTAIYEVKPDQCAAGSLLTTADDFSKLMAAWLENMDDPIIKQAFEPRSTNDFPTCGLGWHIYRDLDKVIAYQFGENPNTRSFVAINVKDKKGAAFFTNSENGMSIANQILTSSDLSPIGNMQMVFKHLHYSQSDEPGWQQTLEGKIAEDQGKSEEARGHSEEARRYFEKARLLFEKALELSPNDESKQRRLKWFNAVHQPALQKQAFTQPLDKFVGKLTNDHNDKIDIDIRGGGLIYTEFDREIKLVRISETEFLPEKDQSFKISFNGAQVSILYVHGAEKLLSNKTLIKSQGGTSSYASIARLQGYQPDDKTQAKHSDIPVAPPEKTELSAKKSVENEEKIQAKPTTEHETQYRPK